MRPYVYLLTHRIFLIPTAVGSSTNWIALLSDINFRIFVHLAWSKYQSRYFRNTIESDRHWRLIYRSFFQRCDTWTMKLSVTLSEPISQSTHLIDPQYH
jgi:hypothetical protein